MQPNSYILLLILFSFNLNGQSDSLDTEKLLSNAFKQIDSLPPHVFDEIVAKGFESIEKKDDLNSWLKWHRSIGKKYHQIAQHERAIFYLNHGISNKWRKPRTIKEVERLAKIMLYKGWVFNKGFNDSEAAAKCYEECKTLYRDSLQKPDIYLAKYVYNALGNIYWSLRDEKKATHYFQLSLDIAEENKDWKLFSQVTNNLSGFLNDINKPEEGLEVLLEGLTFIDSLSAKRQVSLLHGIGLCYYHLQDYSKARKYTAQANRSTKTHTRDLDKYNRLEINYNQNYNLGRINKAEGKYSASEKHYLAALKILKTDNGYGGKRATVTMLHNLGVLFQESKKTTKAKKYFQESIELLSKQLGKYKDPFLISEDHLFGESKLDYAYEQLGILFLQDFEESKNLEDIKKGIRYFELAALVNDLQLQTYSSEQSRLNALSRQRALKESIQNALYQLWEISPKSELVEKMFFYSDKSRAEILAASQDKKSEIAEWNETQKTVYDSLKTIQKNLIADLFQIESKSIDPNSSEVVTLKNTLLELEDKIATLESPQTKTARQNNRWTNNFLNTAQASLDRDQALIEYFLGEKHLYIYSITQNSIKVISVENSPAIIDQTNAFKSLLTNHNEAYDSIRLSSSSLYEKIVAPCLPNLPPEITRLVFSKDRSLNLIPFEVLGHMESGSQRFKYLIEDFAISYASSAEVFANQKNIAKERANFNFLGYAPTYKPVDIQNQEQSESTLYASLVRSGKYDLAGAKREVEHIASDLNGTGLYGSEATKTHFMEHAKNFKILLLSMHGVLNENKPNYSELLFTTNSDQGDVNDLNDNLLHPFEIKNLELNADLAVLSACETGAGKDYPGEGVFSFSRAFNTAGVPSTLMTLWKVNDESTSDLIINFFKHLKNKDPKDIALQKAKLNYLSVNQMNRSALHPYFWAGLQVSGNTSPLNLSQSFFSPKSLALLAFTLILIFLFLYFKNK